MTSLEQIEPRAEWDQRPEEQAAEYAWFKQYLNLGHSRTPARTANRCGVSSSIVKDAATTHDWKMRAKQYDEFVQQIRTARVSEAGEEVALHAQYMAGEALVQMGITGMGNKNADMFKVKQLIEMIMSGTEMMRRGAGVADLKIDHTTTSRIDDLWQDVIGE